MNARPAVSKGSEMIAAEIPGREQPVQDRLYAEHQGKMERQTARQHESMMLDADGRMPLICETSRKCAAQNGARTPERLAGPPRLANDDPNEPRSVLQAERPMRTSREPVGGLFFCATPG